MTQYLTMHGEEYHCLVSKLDLVAYAELRIILESERVSPLRRPVLDELHNLRHELVAPSPGAHCTIDYNYSVGRMLFELAHVSSCASVHHVGLSKHSTLGISDSGSLNTVL